MAPAYLNFRTMAANLATALEAQSRCLAKQVKSWSLERDTSIAKAQSLRTDSEKNTCHSYWHENDRQNASSWGFSEAWPEPALCHVRISAWSSVQQHFRSKGLTRIWVSVHWCSLHVFTSLGLTVESAVWFGLEGCEATPGKVAWLALDFDRCCAVASWLGTDGLVRVDEYDIRHAMTARGWKFYDKSVAAAMKSHSWPLRKPPGKLRVTSVVVIGWLLSWMVRDLQLARTKGYTLFLA